MGKMKEVLMSQLTLTSNLIPQAISLWIIVPSKEGEER